LVSDEAAFRSVYEECYPRVLAYAASVVGREAGEDVAGDAFLVAWRKWADLPDPPLPYLLGIARNLIREFRRRSGRQYELAAAAGRRLSAGADDPADDVAERITVLRALATLPDADRELLTLIAWQGLTNAQAAQVLGCSTATLAVRLHRARRRLERAQEDTGNPAVRRPVVVAEEM
jgi:RNA polymerase sigma-70 factor, ECF subfamily